MFTSHELRICYLLTRYRNLIVTIWLNSSVCYPCSLYSWKAWGFCTVWKRKKEVSCPPLIIKVDFIHLKWTFSIIFKLLDNIYIDVTWNSYWRFELNQMKTTRTPLLENKTYAIKVHVKSLQISFLTEVTRKEFLKLPFYFSRSF